MSEIADRREREERGVGEFAIEQAIRRSHCSKSRQAGHRCVGNCIIMPDKVVLSCKLCGTERIEMRDDCLDEAQANALVTLSRKALGQ